MLISTSSIQLYWIHLLLLSTTASFLTLTIFLLPSSFPEIHDRSQSRWEVAGPGSDLSYEGVEVPRREILRSLPLFTSLSTAPSSRYNSGDDDKNEECFSHMISLHPDESLLQRKFYHEMKVRQLIRRVKVPKTTIADEMGRETGFKALEVNTLPDLATPRLSDTSRDAQDEWKLTQDWVTLRQLYPPRTNGLSNVLHRMSNAQVKRVMLPKEGQNYKVMMVLEGGQRVVFKPKLFDNDYVESPYPEDTATVGKEKHYCSIAAFHLDRILGFNRSPIVVGRRIHVKRDLIPVSEMGVFHNFTYEANGEFCFHIGDYDYPEYLCADEDGMIDGAVVLWLEGVKLGWRNNPWSFLMYTSDKWRKYTPDMFDTNSSLCAANVRSFNKASNRTDILFLDLVDGAIYDFLLDNIDRHSFDVIKEKHIARTTAVLLIDNGSSMGNPNVDQLTTLAPLYQCCSLRRSTWTRLKLLSNGRLSSLLRDSLSHDPLSPLLIESHYTAFDRRLIWIYKVAQNCFDTYGQDQVLIDK